MKEQWRNLSARFDALQVRERVLVLFAAVACTALIIYSLALQPLEAQNKLLTQQITEARWKIKTADSLMKSRENVFDPSVIKRAYRDALLKQLAEIDLRMQGLQRGLVPPERMAKLLEDVLTRSNGLRFVALRTLPAQRVEIQQAGHAAPTNDQEVKLGANSSERTIYQHGVEITLQGSYADLHNYLDQLEQLPSQMFWGRICVITERYPWLRVTLMVHTLSLNKAWLIV